MSWKCQFDVSFSRKHLIAELLGDNGGLPLCSLALLDGELKKEEEADRSTLYLIDWPTCTMHGPLQPS